MRAATPALVVAILLTGLVAPPPAFADEVFTCKAKPGRVLKPSAEIAGPSGDPVPAGLGLEAWERRRAGGATWYAIGRAPASGPGYVLASLLDCDARAVADLKEGVDGLCKVADPSGTPTNLRDAPAGRRVIASYPSGTNLRRQAGEQHVRQVNGKDWARVYLVAYDNPLGWAKAGDVTCREVLE